MQDDDEHVDEEIDTGEQPAADQEDDAEIEARARRAGWVPEEDWDDERAAREGIRKPTRFVTAREWLARVDGDNKMLRERNRHLDGELKRVSGSVSEQKTEIAELRQLIDDLHGSLKNIGQRAYDKARADIDAKMKRSVAEADTEGFDAAQQELKALDEDRAAMEPKPKANGDGTQTPPPKKDGTQMDPAIQKVLDDWVAENPWYEEHEHLRSAATGIHGKLKREHPDWSFKKNLDEVADEIRRRFPEDFENQARRTPPTVSPPSGDRTRRRGGETRTFDELSDEQKAVYERQKRYFEKKGAKYTKEEFLHDQLYG